MRMKKQAKSSATLHLIFTKNMVRHEAQCCNTRMALKEKPVGSRGSSLLPRGATLTGDG